VAFSRIWRANDIACPFCGQASCWLEVVAYIAADIRKMTHLLRQRADRARPAPFTTALAQLRVGEGWIWPLDHLLAQMREFPPIATLNTSKTPRAGDAPITAPVLQNRYRQAQNQIRKIEGRPEGRTIPQPVEPQRTKGPIVVRVRAAAPRQTRLKTPPRDPVAAAIVRARANAKLTQGELAGRLNTHQGNIARLERGRTQATVRTLKRIASATGHPLWRQR
jgi:hypothetical protein